MKVPQNTQLTDKISFKDITVIIPVLNEEENVGLLIKTLEKLCPGISIFFVDDGSKDKTRKIIKNFSKKNEKIKLIDRSKEKIHGLCASVIDGIFASKTEYFVVMDGDLQHPPEAILNFKKKFEEGSMFVVGCRKKVKNWKIERKSISKVASFLGKTSLIIRRKKYPKDILSGFFGGKTSVFKKIIKENYKKFQLKGYKILFDILKVLPLQIKFSEFFYNFGQREKGKSKIKIKHILSFFWGLIK